MKNITRQHLIKLGVLAFYLVAIFSVYAYIHWNGIPIKALPSLITKRVELAGAWGPLVMILIFCAQTVIPFATIGLNVISGILFGPWIGSLIVIIGLNISAAISFFIGRFLGRHLVDENEKGWVKKYDDLLTEQGFISIFAMRVLQFPFDFVSLGAGMTRMTYRQYALGSLLGSLPGGVTFVILGDSFGEPDSWALFFGLLIFTVAIVYFMRRSQWAKTHLFKQVDPKIIG